jgi:hypothetical protein
MTLHVPTAEVVLKMTDAEFIALCEPLTVDEMDVFTKRLFSGGREDDEALCAKYRALADHRCKQLKLASWHRNLGANSHDGAMGWGRYGEI